MQKTTALVLILFLTALQLAQAATPVKNWKVISLAPNITELLFAIGKGRSVIADTRQCDYPQAARSLAKIGDMSSVNVEKIVSLKPDIVIASWSGNSREQAERIASFGIKVLTLRENSVNDILSNTVLLGKVFEIDVTVPLRTFRAKLKSVRPAPVMKKALLLVSAFPFYAVSTNTFMGDMLRIAGLENTVRTSVGYPLLTREELAMLRPQTVILPDRYKKEDAELKKLFSELGHRPAVVYLDEDEMSRPGPRVFDTIIKLSRLR
jgi:iron complex transport system substrate-binding protein